MRLDRGARIAWLADAIRSHKDAYYNADNPSPGKVCTLEDGRRVQLVTDAVYDGWERELRSLDPRNAVLKQVGAPLPKRSTFKKVQLPHYMGSLSKIHADGSAAQFIANTRGPWTISDKLDGVSILADGEADGTHLFTRGKGTTGFDVSVLAPYIWGGQGRLRKGTAIRGELHVDNRSFGQWSDSYANTRALASAIVNSTGSTGVIHPAASSATLIIHSQVYPPRPLADVGPALKAAGWIVVPYVVVKQWRDPEMQLTAMLATRRSRSSYELDGLVITDADGNSIAFKGADDELVATVREVAWNASRFGSATPVVFFTEPVGPLAGVMVSKATAHNARMVEQLGIGPGAQVSIARAGGVIPKIVSVVKAAKPQFPPRNQWDWDANHTDIILRAGNATNDAAICTRQLTNFVNALGLRGLKELTMAKLVAAGVTTPAQLMQLTADQIAATGIGNANTVNLSTNLWPAIRAADHATLMQASGVFPAGWGERRLHLLFDHVNYAVVMRLAAGTAANFVAGLIHIDGMEQTLLAQLQPALMAYQRWLYATGLAGQRRQTVQRAETVDGPLSGQNVVFTRVRDPEAAARIRALGGTVTERVTEGSWVVAPPGVNSGKLKQAARLGIKPIDLPTLRRKLGRL